LGAADAVHTWPSWLRAAAALLGSALTMGLLFRPLLAHAWPGAKGVLWISVLTLLAFLLWYCVQWLVDRSGALEASCLCLLVLGITSLVLLLSGSQKFGQIGGALTAAFAGCVIAAWRFGTPGLLRRVNWVVLPLFSALLFAGHFYASLRASNAALLFASLGAACLAELAPAGPARQWPRRAVRLAIVLVPSVAALAAAAIEFGRSLADQPAGYEY
jgi:hypothetical protein